MRLPFLQVDQKAFASARLLGRLLGMSEAECLGRMLKLWAAVLDLTPEDHPPERMGLVLGEDADLFLAANFEWEPPEETPDDFTHLINAMEMAGFLERHTEGLRLRGLARYGQVLAKQQKDRERWRLKKKGGSDVPGDSEEDSARVRANSRGVPASSRELHASPREVSASLGEFPGQTQTYTYTEASSFPAADAPDEGQPLLRVVTSANPKPPRMKKPPNPRHSPLTQRLADVFREVRGQPYGHSGGPDAKAVSRLLALGDDAEVERRWRIGLAWPGYPRCDSFAQLAQHWNTYATPAHRGGPDSPFNPSPVAGGDVPRL